MSIRDGCLDRWSRIKFEASTTTCKKNNVRPSFLVQRYFYAASRSVSEYKSHRVHPVTMIILTPAVSSVSLASYASPLGLCI